MLLPWDLIGSFENWDLMHFAYVLDLLESLGINPIFNGEDLAFYRGTFEPPFLPFGVCT